MKTLIRNLKLIPLDYYLHRSVGSGRVAAASRAFFSAYNDVVWHWRGAVKRASRTAFGMWRNRALVYVKEAL